MVIRSRKESAGILAFRGRLPALEVLLAHPGGPVFRRKDAGVWTIPKGEIHEGEAPLAAAQREFEEETSFRVEGPFLPLGSVKLKSGKIVHAWACRAELDPTRIRSITFQMEWPPRSGKLGEYPEVDRADYFSLEVAKEKLNEAQGLLLPRLVQALEASESEPFDVSDDGIKASPASARPVPFRVPERFDRLASLLSELQRGRGTDALRRVSHEDGVILKYDWPNWLEEGRTYLLPGGIERADLETARKVLTIIVREDRFLEGSLEASVNSGLAARIVRRIVELAPEATLDSVTDLLDEMEYEDDEADR